MKAFQNLRRKVGAMIGGFEGGLSARRLKTFAASRAHVNTLIHAAGADMTARARYLIRNNGYAANAVESWAGNAVGTGIKPSSGISDAQLKDRVQRLWLRWTDESDAEGLTDFYGQQRRAARELFIAGEVFFRIRPRRPEDGLSVPLQLQMLPAEMLPLNHNQLLENGHRIRQGIEFDRIGRRVAYHFLRRHPGDITDPGLAGEAVRVPAESVLHIVDPVDAGQLRGVSRFSPALVKLFLLDQYDDAELDRKKVAAMFVGFVRRPERDFDNSNETDDRGEPLLPLEPGQLQILDDGEDITFSTPADVGGNYESFQYRTLLQVAAALGLPYANLSADMLKANYSNTRAALLEFRRRIEAFQHSVLVFQLCRAVWARWMDTAVLSGQLDLPDYEQRRADYLDCSWLPPRWDWVDPLKDIRAEINAIEAGLKSRTQAIAERGFDAAMVDAEIAGDHRREDSLGLRFGREPAPVPAPTPTQAPPPAPSNRGIPMTDLPYLASRLYGTPLLIAHPKLEVILGVVARKLTGDTLATPPPSRTDSGLGGDLQVQDGIAILPVLGTLVRRSSYIGAASGLTSYHDIEAMAEQAFADPEVRAVLLEIDSSGGEAGGVFDLAQRLRALSQTSGKPLWAIADEAALSAAYAIAAAADRIWLTRTAEVGSIGVVAVHVDESVADAKAGLNYTFLHAGAHKVDGHPHAPLPAPVAADIQADIEQLHTQFIALVAGFRRLTPEAIRDTEARVYRGEAALQAGLADQIGTRAEAITALQRQLTMSAGRSLRNQAAALSATRTTSRSQLSPKEISMNDHNPVTPVDDTQEHTTPSTAPSTSNSSAQSLQTPPLDEAAITAQVEQRLRRQLAELTEIAAQAKRLGVTVDPAQALARSVTPDTLRQSVLKQAAERDVAQDIVAEAPPQPHTKPQSVADSPLVKAAQAYGGRQ